MFLFCAGSRLKKVKKKKKKEQWVSYYHSPLLTMTVLMNISLPIVSPSKLLSQNSIILPGNWDVSSDLPVYNDLKILFYGLSLCLNNKTNLFGHL